MIRNPAERRAVHRAVWLYGNTAIGKDLGPEERMTECRKVAAKQLGVPLAKITKARCKTFLHWTLKKVFREGGNEIPNNLHSDRSLTVGPVRSCKNTAVQRR